MVFAKNVLIFFVWFFLLQFVLGKSGIVSFVQQQASVRKLYDNVNDLVEIQDFLNKQVVLNQNHPSYLLMNAHRVGLLAEDEYLIKFDKETFFTNKLYSPGALILDSKQFYVNNNILFLISLFITFTGLTISLFKRILVYRRAHRE